MNVIRRLRALARRVAASALARATCRAEAGQSTTEYTLVILVAATIALLLLNWAQGGAVVAFFDAIFQRVVDMFS